LFLPRVSKTAHAAARATTSTTVARKTKIAICQLSLHVSLAGRV
jgi:hypothetical protein